MIFQPGNLESAAHMSTSLGTISRRSKFVGLIFEQRALAEQNLIRAVALGFSRPTPLVAFGLRIEVEEEDFFAGDGEAGGEVDSGGGFFPRRLSGWQQQ